MEPVDGLRERAERAERGNEVFEEGEVFSLGGCDDVAEDDDEGDEGGEKDCPNLSGETCGYAKETFGCQSLLKGSFCMMLTSACTSI